jgi:RHS repeat-associated protein
MKKYFFYILTFTAVSSLSFSTQAQTILGNAEPCQYVYAGYFMNASSLGCSSYSWSVGGGETNGGTSTSSVQVKWTSSGAKSVSCSCYDTFGQFKGSASFPLTVKPSAQITVSASPSEVIIGGQVTLSASGASGYTWGGEGLHSTSGSTVTATPPLGVTIYFATQTNTPPGNCVGSGSVSVRANLPPVDAGPDRFYCKETAGVINLSDLGLSLSEGQWRIDNQPITGTTLNIGSLSVGPHNMTYKRNSDQDTDDIILTVAKSAVGTISVNATSSCSATLIGTLSAGGVTGTVKFWEFSYDDGANWSVIQSTANPYPYSETQSFQARVTVQDSDCTPVTSLPANVNGVATVTGSVDISGVTIACTIVSGSISVSGSNGAVSFWERSDDGGLNWGKVPGSDNLASLPISATAPVRFKAAIQRQNCPIVYTDPVSLEPGAPRAGTLTFTDVTISCGRSTGSLELQNYKGDKFIWQYSTDGNTWNTLSVTEAHYEFDVTTETRFAVKVEQTGLTCAEAVSNIYTAYVSTREGTLTTSAQTAQCGRGTGQLILQGLLGSVVSWEHSINGSDWQTIDNSSGKTSLSFDTEQPDNYYRAAVQLENCAVRYTTAQRITVSAPTMPGIVRFIHEEKAAEIINGVRTFYPVFELSGENGPISNWVRYTYSDTGTEPSDYASVSKVIKPEVTETNGFRANVQNGACDALLSGQAIFVVNKNYLGTLIVQAPGLTINKYEGYSYQVKTGNGVEIREEFKFIANTEQDFFVLLDDSYTLPPVDKSYTVEETIMQEGITSEDGVYFSNAHQRQTNYVYVDDIGRPEQQVKRKANPFEKDIVVPVAYDAVGRVVKDYMPYVAESSDGHFKTDALAEQSSFYLSPPEKVAATDYPYAVKIYEKSPLNRVREQGSPGAEWQPGAGRVIHLNYPINGGGEARQWIIDVSSGRPKSSGFYPANELRVKETVDEQGFSVREYIDKRGHVVIKRVQLGSEWIETHYVFDDFGLLRYTIQPEGIAQLNGDPDENFIDKWVYQYRYDKRKRLIEKKIPGAGWVYMIYDERDRLVLTQDANQRTLNEWMFTKYDQLNRIIVNGIHTYNDPSNPDKIITRSEMAEKISQQEFSEEYIGTTDFYGYTNTIFPVENIQVLTVSYYDNYNFIEQVYQNWFQYSPGVSDKLPQQPNIKVKGIVTGAMTRILNSDNWQRNVTWFDKQYKAIQTLSENHLGGIDRSTSICDFTGKVVTSILTHEKPNQSITIKEEFNYDHAGRLLAHYHSVNANPKVLLKSLQYNTLGQLTEKNLHGGVTGALQSIDYRYNIRGFLTHINNANLLHDGGITNDDGNDWFGMELRYQNPSLPSTAAQFNGNISEMEWKSSGQGRQLYAFEYDPLNRLKAAMYYDLENPLNNGRYNEIIGGYDRNGNIQNLDRFGKAGEIFEQIDKLRYEYTGNRLLAVTETGTNHEEGFNDVHITGDDYTYDANGNMSQDQNKTVDIHYNLLNLPQTVLKQGGTERVDYTYSASGVKLAQVVGAAAVRTDYSGPFQYENGVLKFIQHAEGRLLPNDGAWEYQYFLKDHLGNIRVTFTAAPQIESFMATLETENQPEESAQFINYNDVAKVNATLFDHTVIEETHYAMRLDKKGMRKKGLAKAIAVMPGDTIKLEVFGKYIDADKSNWNMALKNAMLTISSGGVTPGAVDAPVQTITGVNNIPVDGLLTKGEDDKNGVQGYLNYLVFDRNFKFRDGGYIRLTDHAKENGSGVEHEQLYGEIVADQQGYVYAYLSNEGENASVYFDDFSITQVHSAVIQVENYYPFGLTFNSFATDNSVAQKFGFNGKEQQDQLGLNWLDYGARMYHPETGRWSVIDPMAEQTSGFSPYNYAFNNPVLFIDPDGMLPTYNWNNGNYEDEDEYGKFTVSWGQVQSQIKGENGIRASVKIKGFGNIAVWNYLSSTEDKPRKVDVEGMDAGNQNWDILEIQNGDLGAALKIIKVYKQLSLAINNFAIAEHGGWDKMSAVQDEKGFKHKISPEAVNNFLAGGAGNHALMNKHLGDLLEIANSMRSGGNIFFLSCYSGYTADKSGLAYSLGNMLLSANNNINVFLPIGVAWAGQGKREIRFGSKGVEAGGSTVGWTIVNRNYSLAPLQTTGSIKFNKTGEAVTFPWSK